MRVAVIFSPGAGQKQSFTLIGQKLEKIFRFNQIVTSQGSFGGDYLLNASICAHEQCDGYVQNLGKIVSELLVEKMDLLITVGGDGIASYVADKMIALGKKLPMMGIGAGTANVGPIVCVSIKDLDFIDMSQYSFTKVGAIEVIAGEHVGYAFNDVIIGNTFLGSDNERIVNFSAEEMALYGKKVICQPSKFICNSGFSVTKNGKLMDHHIQIPGQIVISPLDRDRLEGRAIYGALCSAAYTPCKGAIALTDETLTEDDGMKSFSSVEYLLFGPDDNVVIKGLDKDAQLILDGNPYLRNGKDVSLSYVSDCITVFVPRITR